MNRRCRTLAALPVLAIAPLLAFASPARAQHWATVWTGAAQGPFPTGITAAQPSLSAAFPNPGNGSHEQTFRLIVKPDLFGRQMRFRFSNAFGAKPVAFDTAFAGLQMSGAAVVPGTNRPITFAGKPTVTIAPGAEAWSDPVLLPFVHDPGGADLAGRRLAVTFHIPGDSGPMTWHALAMTTSYVTAPEAGAIGQLEDDSAYPYSATSWFFLDAVDAMAGPETRVVVCLGDGVTDGVGATLNGDDRWTDVLSRRLHAVDGVHVVVVNEGMAGNQVMGAADHPGPGGPSASARLDRDVLSLSGVTHVIWLEGEGDLAAAGAKPDAVRDAMATAVTQMRERIHGVKVLGATLTSTRGSAVPGFGTVDADDRRHALNTLLAKPGLFDSMIDFDAATVDQQTGELRPEFLPPSTGIGAGDKITLNRPGYLAMGDAVELRLLAPAFRPRPVYRPRPVAKPDEPAAPSSSVAPGGTG
jgi:lysophospholipase L1-like esterase